MMQILVSILLLLRPDVSPVADGVEQVSQEKKELLDRLLADYRLYELPLPSADAPLVKVQFGVRGNPDEEETPLIVLAFLLRKETAERKAELLIGDSSWTAWWKGGISPAPLEPASANNVEMKVRSGEFETLVGLATAIQCHARGWSDLAAALLDVSLKEEYYVDLFPYEDIGREKSPKERLAFLAWAHRVNELYVPSEDRTRILRQLKALTEREPRLRTKENQQLLKSLEAALVPGKAKPGTVESSIDALVDMKGPGLREQPPAEVLALLELGFDAVPDLIAHLDDIRLTRYRASWGLSNYSPVYPWSVSLVSFEILSKLAGRNAASTWSEEESGNIQKSRVTAWFEEVRKTKERDYLSARALPPGEWPDQDILRILGAKFPGELAQLYKELLEKRSAMQSWPIAKVWAQSRLPLKEKIELLATAARDKVLRHRYAALGELRGLDAGIFSELLSSTLENLPRTPDGPVGNSQESYFALLVRDSADPRAWQALEKAARRVDPGLRAEFLGMVSWSGTEGEIRHLQVRFLSAFLDDDAVRDAAVNPEKYKEAVKVGRFPRIEIRNLAALHLASILELPADAKPGWDVKDWAGLRSRVKEFLTK